MKSSFLTSRQPINVSILDVMQKCKIELKQVGNKYSTFCPLHKEENSASFFVMPDTNSWICYGNCTNPKHPGKRNGGDVVEFVMQFYNKNYNETVKWLKDNFSLSIRKKDCQLKIKKPKELPKIENKTINYYHSLLDLTKSRDWFLNERGFSNKTINEQALGFDGENHIIPIWKEKSRTSDCLCIKLRSHNNNGPKYVRFGSYQPYLYNIYTCKNANTIYGFAGELDALLASQDGLPSFSLINGAKSIYELPENWSNIFFPKTKKLIIIFDRKEDLAASFTAKSWDKYKGKFTSKIFQWSYFGGSDYTDYRIKYGHSFQEFKQLLEVL